MSDALYCVAQKFQMSGKPFFSHVVVGFWRHSNQQASCFGHDIIFSSKKSEVETKNPQKERCDSNAL